MRTEAQLHVVMPTEDELTGICWGWRVRPWWSIEGLHGRVFLNDGGRDDELRFILRHPNSKVHSIPCIECSGTGRIKRLASEPGFFAKALRPDRTDWSGYDAADENGLRSCYGCSGKGEVKPYYGACNDFCRVPDFDPVRLRRTGARGMSEPTKEDVLYVLDWLDKLYFRLLHGETL